MPLSFAPAINEGKVYRGGKKKQRDQAKDDEEQAFKELQTILSRKNRKPCECQAQVHDLVENCLNCGYLTCTAEGPGKCLSCGSIILDQKQRVKLSKYIDIVQSSPSKANLNHNLPSCSRIIDSQTIDQFAIDNKKHLKESEKMMLKATLEELQSKRYQRKLVFEVDVDNMEAGSRSTGLIDDYEAELRMLQLADNTGPLESNFSLAELVHRESKKNYLFEYIEPIDEKKRTILPQQKPDSLQQATTSENQSQRNMTYGPQSKPNKNYEYKTNHKHNLSKRADSNRRKSGPKSNNAWNKSSKPPK